MRIWLVAAALVLALVVGWRLDHLTLNNQLSKEKAARLTREAQAQAAKLEYTQNAKAADGRYAELLAQYNANLVRYKQMSASSRSQAPAPQSGNGPSENSGIYISVRDAEICTENTARLVAVHDWALAVGGVQ